MLCTGQRNVEQKPKLAQRCSKVRQNRWKWEGATNQRTNQLTNGWTNEQTDRPSDRGAFKHLEINKLNGVWTTDAFLSVHVPIIVLLFVVFFCYYLKVAQIVTNTFLFHNIIYLRFGQKQHFARFQLVHDRRTDRWTEGWTDRWTLPLIEMRECI